MVNPVSSKKRSSLSNHTIGKFLLILAAFFWGCTFVLVKAAVEDLNLHYFLFYRFTLAAIILALLFPRKISKNFANKDFRKMGVILGVFVYGSFLFQTIGLTMTTASNAAFVTGMNVLFVPIIAIGFGLGFPNPRTTLAVTIAFIGLIMLTLDFSSMEVSSGDAWVVLCAICIAFHILFSEQFAKQVPPEFLAWSQIATTAGLALILALVLAEGDPFVFTPIVILTLIVTACFATGFAYIVQSWAQSSEVGVSSSTVALIFILEPVFALIIDVLLGTNLGWNNWLGAGLIFCGMLLAVTEPKVQDMSLPPH